MKKAEEIWRSLPELGDKYEVSNFGNVRSKYRTMAGCKDGAGYICSMFRVNGNHGVKRFHTLVARAFIENPLNKPFVNHKNGIKSDNRVENLEWCTPYENSEHATRTGLHDLKGEKAPHSKLTEIEVLQIRELDGKFTRKQIGSMFGISREQSRDIIRRKNWKHI
jgi:hypothetical protein